MNKHSSLLALMASELDWQELGHFDEGKTLVA